MGRFLIFAHNRTISLYSVIEQSANKWFAHFELENEIEQIFRQRNSEGDFELVVLDRKGVISVLTQEKGSEGADPKEWKFSKNPGYQLEGRLVEYSQDREDNKWTVFLTQLPNGMAVA